MTPDKAILELCHHYNVARLNANKHAQGEPGEVITAAGLEGYYCAINTLSLFVETHQTTRKTPLQIFLLVFFLSLSLLLTITTWAWPFVHSTFFMILCISTVVLLFTKPSITTS